MKDITWELTEEIFVNLYLYARRSPVPNKEEEVEYRRKDRRLLASYLRAYGKKELRGMQGK